MIQVLIVDDEPGALKSLKYMLDWDEYGYSITGEAANGKQALEMLKTGSFQLIITDIRMPGMSGLELIQGIREVSAELPIIAMSGYEEFEYVRECLRHGVKDYLLKPVDQGNLAKLLVSIREELMHEFLTNKQLYHGVPALRDRTLKRWAHGLLSDEEIRAELQYLNIHVDGYLWVCPLLVEINFQDLTDSSWTESEIGIRRFAVVNVLEELLEHRGYMFEESNNRLGVVLIGRDEKYREEDVLNIAELSRDSISKYAKVSVTIAVGDPVEDLAEMASSFRTTLRRMEMNFLFQGHIISASEFKAYEMPLNSLVIQDIEGILNAVTSKDGQLLSSLLEAQKQQFLTYAASKRTVQSFVLELFTHLFRLIKEMEEPYQHIFESETNELKNILDLTTLDETMDFTEQKCREVIMHLKQLKMSSSEKTVDQVKKIVKQKYANNIHLKMIAEEIHMNPTYLGQIFKSTVGMSFNDYLMRTRMEKAKSLVLHTDKKIYEIALEVGFRQLDAFYKRFKEYTGKSASELRTETQ